MPRPELLSQYYDGELDHDPARKSLVENWLATCPEAAEQIETYENIEQLLEQTVPLEPDDFQWQKVVLGIEDGCRRRHERWAWLSRRLAAGMLGSTAAAVLLTLMLIPKPQTDQQARPAPTQVEAKPSEAPVDPWQVATSDEIEILRVGGDDTGSLVVGDPPVEGMLELASPGEVTLYSVEPAEDNMIPDVRFQGPSAPIVWAQLDSER